MWLLTIFHWLINNNKNGTRKIQKKALMIKHNTLATRAQRQQQLCSTTTTRAKAASPIAAVVVAIWFIVGNANKKRSILSGGQQNKKLQSSNKSENDRTWASHWKWARLAALMLPLCCCCCCCCHCCCCCCHCDGRSFCTIWFYCMAKFNEATKAAKRQKDKLTKWRSGNRRRANLHTGTYAAHTHTHTVTAHK